MAKLTHLFSISLDLETSDKIRDVSERFGLKFSEICRECIINDLPKLIDRHAKAQKRGLGRYKKSRHD